MKIRMDMDARITEEEVIIRCGSLSEKVQKVQQALIEAMARAEQFAFYKGEREYYLPLGEILFFETGENVVCAHTADEVYQVKYKLYELEEILPGCFMRISKSAILNLDRIYSIERKLSVSSIVQFRNSHKQVYVSRYYCKPLKERMEGRIRG